MSTEENKKAKAVVWQAINAFCSEEDSERKSNLKEIIDIYLDDLCINIDILTVVTVVVNDPSPENIEIAKEYIRLLNNKNIQRNHYLDTLVELDAILAAQKGSKK